MRTIVPVLLVVTLLGCRKVEPTLAGGKPPAQWVQALNDPDPAVRKNAARKLGNVGAADPAALPALTAALNDPDAGVRAEVILALVKFGPEAKDAVPRLTQIQRGDANARVRDYASKALARIVPPSE
jgi:HEAT repeat protein